MGLMQSNGGVHNAVATAKVSSWMGLMQSNGGVHNVVATAKVSSWMGLMETNGGVHMGTETVTATQCERALSSTFSQTYEWLK